MCGIAGVAALTDVLSPEVRAAIRPMCDRLRHRGPDGEGFRDGSRMTLGHRRLAIIDRAGGRQPLSNEDGTVWIAFNGEIYNHRALRRQLEGRGHVFRTRSDTEVIVHAFEEFGEACVERLNGMFAFAIADERRNVLFLARDRLGQKPLFYAELSGVLHFASEISALHASPLWEGELDPAQVESYFTLGYCIAPRTIYRRVQQLEPGCWLRVRDGRVTTKRYWDVERFGDDRRAIPELVAELEPLLFDVVADRLESEVPLGAFLSGGIDSGLVVSLMAESGSERVRTTTVGFGDRRHNEIEAAATTAAHLHTRHEAHLIAPDLSEVMGPIVSRFGQPLADASAVPTYYVSQAARRSVTVALSGDGGDESFGGYDFRYVPHALEARVRRWIPGAAGRAFVRGLAAVWPRRPWLPRPLRLATILGNLARSPEEAFFEDLCFQSPGEAARLLGRAGPASPQDDHAYEAVAAAYRHPGLDDPVLRAQYADLKVYLPNDVLAKVDRMSMAHGLEVRCPLLDHRLVEWAFRVPTATKLPRLDAKHLLRQVARTRLPPGILASGKKGFTAPIGDWIRGPYQEAFRDEVCSAGSALDGLVDLVELRRRLDGHVSGGADATFSLWAAWVMARWTRTVYRSSALRA